VEKLNKIKRFFLAVLIWIVDIDIREIYFHGGLVLLGYGLWLYSPWVSYSVIGCLLIVTGYIAKGKFPKGRM